MPSSRPGKTLLELLLVVSVIAVLAAILLPAVQKVRTRAARLRDENSFRQVGLAAHGYQTQHGRLPPLTGQPLLPPGYHRHEIPVAAFLLPLLEQPPAEVLWNPHTPPPAGERGPAYMLHVVPAYTSALDPSHAAGRVPGIDPPPAVGNVAFNVQVFGPRFQPCWTIDGKASLASTFPDGTSNTLLLATKRGSCGPDAVNGVRTPPGGSYWWNPSFTGHCDPVPSGHQKANGAVFGHKLPAAVGTGPTFQVTPGQDDCDPDLAQGLHGAGITVGLADGSVRTVAGGLAPRLWRAGLLPNDGAGLPSE
jgi:competence protein ComGC